MSRVALIGAVLLASLSGTVHAAWAQDLSGRWYGEGYQPRGYTQWLADRRPDGSFFVEFREYQECTLVYRQKEAGRWSFSDGVYSVTTTTVEGRAVYFYYSYLLLAFGSGEIEYQHMELGIRFKARKVSDDFEWPSCDKSKLSSRQQGVGAIA